MNIYCCECGTSVDAVRKSGADIYPHLPKLARKVIWSCPTCKNYVGCHPHTSAPLGTIPTPALRELRQQIHSALDPLWRSGRISRSLAYRMLSERLGIENYHTANINSMAAAWNTLREVHKMGRELSQK